MQDYGVSSPGERELSLLNSSAFMLLQRARNRQHRAACPLTRGHCVLGPGGGLAFRPFGGRTQIRSQRVPNYFARREQIRILLLVSMLMLVLMLMSEAAKPKNWYWLWGGQRPATTAINDSEIDTRMPTPARLDRPDDAFQSKPREIANSLAEQEIVHDQPFLAAVDSEMLASIEDNTVLSSRESDAWFGLFRVLVDTDLQTIEAAGEPVSFLQIYRQTKEYRGKLVRVNGSVRRVYRIPAVENELGISHYWQCWLRPNGADSPVVIYTLELPPGFPTGNDVREDASFTGFCYKRWAYLAGDGTRVAPLLLAKTASWTPAKAQPPVQVPAAPKLVVAVVALAALACGIAALVYASTRRAYISDQLTGIRQPTAGNWADLADAKVAPSVQDTLSRIAERPSDDTSAAPEAE